MTTSALDVTDVVKVARDLTIGAAKLQPSLIPVLHKAGQNIKKAAAREATGHPYFKGMGAAWSYDFTVTARGVGIEVGPVKGGAGSLALAYFGNSKTGPILPDPQHLLDDEGEQMEPFIEAALRKSFW